MAFLIGYECLGVGVGTVVVGRFQDKMIDCT